MSARYTPVGWNRAKLVYDAVLVAGITAYLLLYLWLAPALQDPDHANDGQTQAMRAFGSAAFILLTLVLAIGPLARLDRRFLPLLYNRRHFGVLTFVVAACHANAVLGWYFAFSPTDPLVALLAKGTTAGTATALPFLAFGMVALLVLFALAATSHDFWLAFLGPPAWKALHMGVYAAYALVVLHVAFGTLQDAPFSALAVVVACSAALLVGLHLAAALRERRADRALAPAAREAPWLVVGRFDRIMEGRGLVVRPAGQETVAIFRHQGRLSAISNLCAHQNGPLGEGRVLDGCVTCPWHGFQYRLEDGCAPPPYTERLATYRLKLAGDQVWLDPRPNPPGTRVDPLVLPA
jgi:DMSO/TMAO reductase YedYZ heme-binding membrane subunit